MLYQYYQNNQHTISCISILNGKELWNIIVLGLGEFGMGLPYGSIPVISST